MSFYKREDEELLVAPNFVYAPGYTLKAEDKDTYTYPQDGWYWFDTLDDALVGIPKLVNPLAVTMRQARLALLGAGLLDMVNTAISNMPGVEGDAARIEWEYAHEVRRDSPLVSGLAAALSLTEEQLDQLFVVAAGIE